MSVDPECKSRSELGWSACSQRPFYSVAAAGPDGETGYILREGYALPFLAKVLLAVAAVAGAPRAAAVFERSGVSLAGFLGELDAEEEGAAEGIMDQYELKAGGVIENKHSIDAISCSACSASSPSFTSSSFSSPCSSSSSSSSARRL